MLLFFLTVCNFNSLKCLTLLQHAGLFWRFRIRPNSDMDYRILNVGLWCFCVGIYSNGRPRFIVSLIWKTFVHMLCVVLLNSALCSTISCVWILFQTASCLLCFRFLWHTVCWLLAAIEPQSTLFQIFMAYCLLTQVLAAIEPQSTLFQIFMAYCLLTSRCHRITGDS